MISNIEKGAGFRGTCDYNSKGELIGGNMAGTNARELASEFGAVRSLNQTCTRPVFHCSLSAAPGEHLSDAQWNQIAGDYMQKMGFDDNQYSVFRHSDSSCDHIHIVANRIRTTDLTVVHDAHDRRRSHTACREIEAEHGLQSGARREHKNENANSNSETGYCADLRRRIDRAVIDCHGDPAKFVSACEKNGVTARLNQQSTGRIAGVSYSLSGGKEIKGSELGHGYKWQGIEKRIGKTQERVAQGETQVGKKDKKQVIQRPQMEGFKSFAGKADDWIVLDAQNRRAFVLDKTGTVTLYAPVTPENVKRMNDIIAQNSSAGEKINVVSRGSESFLRLAAADAAKRGWGFECDNKAAMKVYESEMKRLTPQQQPAAEPAAKPQARELEI